MTSSELESKIDKFRDLLDDFGKSTFNSIELWQLQREIFQNFKETNFYDREDRQNSWNKFQALVDILRKKQEDINIENEKFADEADRFIDKLNDSIGGGLFSKRLEKDDFTELRKLSLEIFEFIKQPRFPSKERRDAVWKKYNNARDKLKELEDEYYSNIREKINKRNSHSEELTEKIIRTIDACHPDSSLEDLFDLIGILVLYLSGIGFVLGAIGLLLGLKEEKPKNPLKIKSDALRDVKKFITENKNEITREDKQKIYRRLDDVQEDLNKAWDVYKAELDERKKERERKQVEWEKRQKEFEQKKINWEKKQREFLEKLENILEKQNEFLSKIEKRLDSQKEYLTKLNEQLEDLEDKYSEARSDSFRDKVSGWIDETKSKIDRVENDIDSIEEKIRDVKKSIEDLEKKIDEVRGKL